MNWQVVAWGLLTVGLFFGLGWLVSSEPENRSYGLIAVACLVASGFMLDHLY